MPDRHSELSVQISWGPFGFAMRHVWFAHLPKQHSWLPVQATAGSKQPPFGSMQLTLSHAPMQQSTGPVHETPKD